MNWSGERFEAGFKKLKFYGTIYSPFRYYNIRFRCFLSFTMPNAIEIILHSRVVRKEGKAYRTDRRRANGTLWKKIKTSKNTKRILLDCCKRLWSSTTSWIRIEKIHKKAQYTFLRRQWKINGNTKIHSWTTSFSPGAKSTRPSPNVPGWRGFPRQTGRLQRFV